MNEWTLSRDTTCSRNRTWMSFIVRSSTLCRRRSIIIQYFIGIALILWVNVIILSHIIIFQHLANDHQPYETLPISPYYNNIQSSSVFLKRATMFLQNRQQGSLDDTSSNPIIISVTSTNDQQQRHEESVVERIRNEQIEYNQHNVVNNRKYPTQVYFDPNNDYFHFSHNNNRIKKHHYQKVDTIDTYLQIRNNIQGKQLLRRLRHILSPDYGNNRMVSMVSFWGQDDNGTSIYDKNHRISTSRIASLQSFHRYVDINLDTIRYESYREHLLNDWDDNIYVQSEYDFYDDIDYVTTDCIRPQWTFAYYPNCLQFHELIDASLSSLSSSSSFKREITTTKTTTSSSHYNDTSSQYYNNYGTSNVDFLASGYYRDAWLFHHHNFPNISSYDDHDESNNNDDHDEVFVVKHLRMTRSFDMHNFEKIKREALLMERLQQSNVIVTLYGHCGSSTMVEKANELTYSIVPYVRDSMYERGKLKISTNRKWNRRIPNKKDAMTYSYSNSMNNLTDLEKLNIAISIAEGVEQLHEGYAGSSIIHDDVHPDQWLVSNDGRYILNDINNAIFLKYNMSEVVKGDGNIHDVSYCDAWTGGYTGGEYRAPEEYYNHGSDINLGVDIWPMGNMLYSLLTGILPYFYFFNETSITSKHVSYKENSGEIIRSKIKRGILPMLPPYYYDTNDERNIKLPSYVEQRFVEIMKQCYQLESTKRIAISDIVQYLHETKVEYLRQQQ